MSSSAENPFAAPEVAEVVGPGPTGDPEWFAVGPTKLWIMMLMSFGIYGIYWFERHFRFQKRRRGETTMPLARGIFAIFFAHDLFSRIRITAQTLELRPIWDAKNMATIFVVCALAGRMLDRLTRDVLDPTSNLIIAVVSAALILGTAYPLTQVQATANRILDRTAQGHDRNERLTFWNFLVLALGGSLWLLFIVGQLLPADDLGGL